MALQLQCSRHRLGHCIAGGEGAQLTSPTMHAQRRRRNWSRDLASPTAHLNSCTGCSCHSAGMRVLSFADDTVNMISTISPSSKSALLDADIPRHFTPEIDLRLRLVLLQAQLLRTSLQPLRCFLDPICPCYPPPETQIWHVLRSHRSMISEQWIASKTLSHYGFQLNLEVRTLGCA